MIYVGKDPSEIKCLLSRISTRCIVARKTETDFGFAVTDSKTTKYKELVKELKKTSYTPGLYQYIRGSMTVTATKTDEESGEVSGGIIELQIYRGEDYEALPKDSKMKQMISVSNIIVLENVEIPGNYALEFKKSVYDDSEDENEKTVAKAPKRRRLNFKSLFKR